MSHHQLPRKHLRHQAAGFLANCNSNKGLAPSVPRDPIPLPCLDPPHLQVHRVNAQPEARLYRPRATGHQRLLRCVWVCKGQQERSIRVSGSAWASSSAAYGSAPATRPAAIHRPAAGHARPARQCWPTPGSAGPFIILFRGGTRLKRRPAAKALSWRCSRQRLHTAAPHSKFTLSTARRGLCQASRPVASRVWWFVQGSAGREQHASCGCTLCKCRTCTWPAGNACSFKPKPGFSQRPAHSLCLCGPCLACLTVDALQKVLDSDLWLIA